METKPSFEQDAELGRISLLIGAYAPAFAILGLRIGLDTVGLALLGIAAAGSGWWLWFLLRVVKRRQPWDVEIQAAEPIDRDVTAYVATYLLPVLAAKPENDTGYVAYGLAAFLILVVAYRADLGAVNPLAYLFRYRAYRVAADDGVRIVLSRSLLMKDSIWQFRSAAGIVVAMEKLSCRDSNKGDADR